MGEGGREEGKEGAGEAGGGWEQERGKAGEQEAGGNVNSKRHMYIYIYAVPAETVFPTALACVA